MKLPKSSRPRNLKAVTKASLGFSLPELVDKISRLPGVEAMKGLRRQVELALRRGVSYGILVRVRNKYRFDPEKSLLNAARSAGYKKRKRNSRATRSAGTRRQSANKPATQSQQPQRNPPKVPRPTVPPPPNWTQKPRNLSTEPFSKIVKHRNAKKKKK